MFMNSSISDKRVSLTESSYLTVYLFIETEHFTNSAFLAPVIDKADSSIIQNCIYMLKIVVLYYYC